jgi:hypothetical protein
MLENLTKNEKKLDYRKLSLLLTNIIDSHLITSIRSLITITKNYLH